MATNVWVEQEWTDNKLRWDPTEYGGVSTLYVPSEQIWLPDIVLYNNADGNYEVITMTKATIHHDGKIVWKPPAIYKSACQIDITYFPFDQQTCTMKFGTWSYDGGQVDLRHHHEMNGTGLVDVGMDLGEFYLSVEWDVMSVPALRTSQIYSCCPQPYIDITFNITLRRKTLFYTVNLIIPVVGISSLSFLVFYLPSDSGEKVALTISIMLSLTFFLLVLIDIIPSTSLAMPLIGIYLTFCLLMITLSVIVTIAILNVHFRSPSTHKMAPWVRRVFIRTLPKILLMRSPQYKLDACERHKDKMEANTDTVSQVKTTGATQATNGRATASPPLQGIDCEEVLIQDSSPDEAGFPFSPNDSGQRDDNVPESSTSEPIYPLAIERAIHNAMFIAQHIDNLDEFESVSKEV
jgi:nicotinic acetylcholine receptor